VEHEIHDHDRGLAFDMSTLLDRRGMLGLIAGGGVLTLAGCGGGSGGSTSSGSAASTSAGASASASSVASDSCAEIPEETAGPYPGDGSNGPNVLSQSGIVRSDIRSSFGSASGVAEGVPLTIDLTVVDATDGCSALSGAAVYLWHCTIDGGYSLYSEGVADENYLRGVQETDGDGRASFSSIFPAAYSGRWPHIHLEVYSSLDEATSSGEKLATSQIALPEATSKEVYATDGYSQSVSNLAQTSLATDNVFGDGSDTQLGTVTGSVSSGLTVALTVPV
jgi:protocatechuate 3,4-dioxygenase beta subunit